MSQLKIQEGEEHFVDKHQEQLIQNITTVTPVLDHLLQRRLLTGEEYDKVRAEKTDQEKMRSLYRICRGWSISDKDILYQAMKTSNPRVIKNLEGSK
ncbi:apoptosis-associated speck-like protein containing a CARD [Hyperolius riggenbachi]|uniref:apoptosis-associated speck-like protein containing a CARD n=1 Tax=Hyperolius riggenbachi TaxID=752182 RepID=UPI0035A37AA5